MSDTINVGGSPHVDLHLVVPEYWTVEQAHTEMDAYEARIRAGQGRAELQFHVDPCERVYCARCDLGQQKKKKRLRGLRGR